MLSVVYELTRKLFLTHLSEALAAVNQSVLTRLVRYTSLAASACAYSSEHLARSLCAALASCTAVLASLGLMLEALLSVELLLASSEYELVAAVLTYQCLVFVHNHLPHFEYFAKDYGRIRTATFFQMGICRRDKKQNENRSV